MAYGSIRKAEEVAESFKNTERHQEKTKENKFGGRRRTQSNGGGARDNNSLNHAFSAKSV
jgi:hypothetical protein